MPTNAARIFVAEAIGTFTLIFVGVLAIYSNGLVQPPGSANLAAIGLAHGLAIGVSLAALGAMVQAPSLATATRGGPSPTEERGEPTIASG